MIERQHRESPARAVHRVEMTVPEVALNALSVPRLVKGRDLAGSDLEPDLALLADHQVVGSFERWLRQASSRECGG